MKIFYCSVVLVRTQCGLSLILDFFQLFIFLNIFRLIGFLNNFISIKKIVYERREPFQSSPAILYPHFSAIIFFFISFWFQVFFTLITKVVLADHYLD